MESPIDQVFFASGSAQIRRDARCEGAFCQFFRSKPSPQPLECHFAFNAFHSISAFTIGGADTLYVHRFAENINGRDYLIEVSSVGADKWRANIARYLADQPR